MGVVMGLTSDSTLTSYAVTAEIREGKGGNGVRSLMEVHSNVKGKNVKGKNVKGKFRDGLCNS